MEQKHIDDVEEDSFGEEFIDEDYPVLKVDKKKEEKKPAVSAFKPKAAVTTPIKKKPSAFEVDDFDDDEEEIQIKPAKIEPRIVARPEPKVESRFEPKAEPKIEPKVEPKKESISITPAVSRDPDNNSNSDGSMFGKVSTWVVLSLVLLILLIISIFNGGFGYVNSSAAVDKISMDTAETKVLNYVNTNLLTSPFVAEVKDKKEVGNMYKFTLSVAGQEVESYVTIDGKLFFPRGFELNDSNTKPKQEPATVKDTTIPTVTTKPVDTNKSTSAPVVAAPPAVSYNLIAKKWLFDPNILTVKKGQKVKLTVKPLDTGEFTFSISGLGVEKKVVGDTVIEFTPDKVGSYKFLCSSCDGWLKDTMQGTLTVE